jgi:hypothetical protein
MPDTTVILFRASRAEGGRDLFSCSSVDWRLLHELAITFGWKPLGTTYPLPAGSKITALARHDYQPGAPRDIKYVEQGDAVQWARSLESAKQYGHLKAILESQSGSNTGEPQYEPNALATLIDEFAQYAYGGAFSFSLAEMSTNSRDSSH